MVNSNCSDVDKTLYCESISPKKTISLLWKESSVADNHKNRDGEVIDDAFFWEADVNLDCGWVVAENVGALKFIGNDDDLFKHGFTNIPLEFRSFFKAPSSPGKRDIILRYKNQRFQATISLLSRMFKYPMLKFPPEFVQIISQRKMEIESTAQPDYPKITPVMVFEPTDTEDEYLLHFSQILYKPEELSLIFSEYGKRKREEEKEHERKVREAIDGINRYLPALIKWINLHLEAYNPYNPKPAISVGDVIDSNPGKTNLPKTKSNIYYLLPYVPTYQKTWEGRENFLDIAKGILKYKNRTMPEFSQYTIVLLLGILELSRIIPQKRIAITGIPRSTVGSESAICASISCIIKLSKMKGLSLLKDYDKELIDCSDALCRVKSIPVGHCGGFSTDAEKIESLEYHGDMINDGTAYIILDDITTQGNSMRIAKYILMNHGANYADVYMLALSKTVSKYEKL